MSFTMKCPKCGQINDEDNIDGSTYTNEEGEEYYEFDFTCGSCGNEIYKRSGWGEFDLEDSIDEIRDYFSENKEDVKNNGQKFIPVLGDSITLMSGTNDYSEKLKGKKIKILGCGLCNYDCDNCGLKDFL